MGSTAMGWCPRKELQSCFSRGSGRKKLACLYDMFRVSSCFNFQFLFWNWSLRILNNTSSGNEYSENEQEENNCPYDSQPHYTAVFSSV